MRTAMSTAPEDALEAYDVESMLIVGSLPQVDVALLALARAFRRQRFPGISGPGEVALRRAQETLEEIIRRDIGKMKSNWSNSLQLAPAYWDALNLEKEWSAGGGVLEGSRDPKRAKVYAPIELWPSESALPDALVAIRLLEDALEDF